jgi:acetyl esterase/lipase
MALSLQFPPLCRRLSTLALALLILRASFSSAFAVPLSQFLPTAPPSTVMTYKTIDTIPLTFAVFYPSHWKAQDKRAAVVFIHGGAWVAGDGKCFFPHARYFATRGAVAFSIDYRLEKPDGSTLANCLADCKSAIRYIRGHAGELGIDPDKIAAFGDSAGGHLAGALGTCEGFDDPGDNLEISSVPNALILCNPIVDLTEGTWIKFIIRGAAMAKGAKPEDMHPTAEQLSLARALSPLSNIKPGQPPAILMHGTADKVVNPQQALDFATSYAKAGNRCDLAWMEGSGHAFVMTAYSAPEPVVVNAIRKADAFLGSLGWLQGPPTLEVSNPPAWQKRK